LAWQTRELAEALGLGSREHIALVGAGGKTTLMFTLAKELVRKGNTVLTGTTTKVWQEQAENSAQVIITESDSRWKDILHGTSASSGFAFIARQALASGKLDGIAPELADDLYNELSVDYLLMECDGASGKAIKAPAEHEPVVPRSATMVAAVVGGDVLGKPCTGETVFRLEKFMQVTGAQANEILTANLIARLATHKTGLFKGCPESAKRTLFINRMDLLNDIEPVRELADLLSEKCRMIAGSLKKSLYLVYQ